MSDRSKIDILKDSYAALGGDLAAILRDVDPNVEWEEAGPKEIPWAGSFRGHNGVKKFFAAIDAEAEVHSFEPQTFIAEGNKVVVLGFERIRSKRTSRSYECNWAHALPSQLAKSSSFASTLTPLPSLPPFARIRRTRESTLCDRPA